MQNNFALHKADHPAGRLINLAGVRGQRHRPAGECGRPEQVLVSQILFPDDPAGGQSQFIVTGLKAGHCFAAGRQGHREMGNGMTISMESQAEFGRELQFNTGIVEQSSKPRSQLGHRLGVHDCKRWRVLGQAGHLGQINAA